MRRLAPLLALLVAVPALAQVSGRAFDTRRWQAGDPRGSPACVASGYGTIYSIYDGADATDVLTGGGTHVHPIVCTPDGWLAVPTYSTSGAIVSGSICDADLDTCVWVEQSADEDKIRLETGGVERVVVDGAEVQIDLPRLELFSNTGRLLFTPVIGTEWSIGRDSGDFTIEYDFSIPAAVPLRIIAAAPTGALTIEADGDVAAGSRFLGDLTGDVTGNASTATALAANGANCTTGQAAGGVDASGASESCIGGDDTWIGLGASAGRIEFDDRATDEVNVLAARLGVGTATPAQLIHAYVATGNMTPRLETDGVDGRAQWQYLNDAQFWIAGLDPSDHFSFTDQTGGTTPVVFRAGAGDNTLVVDSGSAVGIGTAAPSALLDLVGTGAAAGGIELNSTNEQASLFFFSDAAASNFGISYVGSGTNEIVLTSGGIVSLVATSGKRAAVGTVAPAVTFEIEDTGTDADRLRLQDSDGTCDHNPESGSEVVTCSSDERGKSDIIDAPPISASLRSIRVREWTPNASPAERRRGVVAQEMAATHPDWVAEMAPDCRVAEDGTEECDPPALGVRMPSAWELLQLVQEQADRIDALQQQVAALTAPGRDPGPVSVTDHNATTKEAE